MREYVLYSYKKSSYFHEITNLDEFNYLIGFGNDNINIQLNKELLEISKLLSEKISIEICYDFQKNIKEKKFENLILNDGDEKFSLIKKIKELRKDVQDYSKKKLIIIISNITNVFNFLNIFPKDVIICKCDPVQELVFKLNNKIELDEIIYTEKYNLSLINKIPEKNMRLLKKFRIEKLLKEKNRELETYNPTKLINGFTPERKKVEIPNHQFFFLKYNNLK